MQIGRTAILSILFIIHALASPMVPAAGDLLWQDRFDMAGGFDRGNAVASAGRLGFVAGFVTNAAGNGDGVVRAYETATGALLWEDFLDLGGDDSYISIATAGKIVVACGLGSPGDGTYAFVVRAYNGRSGALVWEDTSVAGGATDVKMDRGLAIVGGYALALDGSFTPLVRAYDLVSGALAWEHVFADGGFVNAIHARRGKVYLAAAANAEADGETHFVIRALSSRTGDLLWQDEDDRSGALDHAASVTATTDRVFVAGTVSHDDGSCTADFFTGNCDFVVRAYDATTGTLLWTDEVDKVGHRDHAYSVVAIGDRVFAGGLGSTDFTRNFLVRAYDGATGALLWEDHQADRGGAANQLAAEGATVYAAGDGALPVTGSSLDFLVRAYEDSTGALLWEDKHDEAGGADGAIGIAVRRGRVLAAGGVVGENGDVDYAVRTYAGN
jgi:hypothetical protein